MSEIRFTKDALIAARGAYAQTRLVQFQDVDAAGIVFYPRFLEYFHDAYVAFLSERQVPLWEALRSRRWAAPLKHAEADYLRPLRFGDMIEVELVAARLEGSDVTIGYRVRRPDGEVVCVGQTNHVFVDPESFRRTEPPDDVKAAMLALVAVSQS